MEVVVGDIGIDLLDQVAHAAQRAAPDCVLGDECEPAFDLIEPTRIGGRVVNLEAPMAREPSPHFGMFVGSVIVGDQVDRERGGNLAVEMVEKAQKLLWSYPVSVDRFGL